MRILDDLQIYLPLFTGMPWSQKTHDWMVLKDYNSIRDVLYLDWPQLAAVLYPEWLLCVYKTRQGKSSHIFMTAQHIWASFIKMYLYKAACSDISIPRQRSVQRSERTPGRFLQRQWAGLSSHHTARCPHWAGRSNSAFELQQLGHFMQIHGYSLKDSVSTNTKMIYRYISLFFTQYLKGFLYKIETLSQPCVITGCWECVKIYCTQKTRANLLILLYQQHIFLACSLQNITL